MGNLGKYLRQSRKIRKLTLRNVEEVTGISNAYLSQLETGKIQKPAPQFLGKLAAIYHVPFDNVMQEAGYLPDQSSVLAQKSTSGPTFNGEELSEEESKKLTEYLAFLRSST